MRRLIIVEFLPRWSGFKGQRVEVTVTTGAPLKISNGYGANQIALQSLVDAFGWEKYRVPTDEKGNPVW
jgi:hypothetical protein